MECRLPGITVHYESIGAGRPLVVLPGWPDSGAVPADYLEPLFADRPRWRRLYVDLPGRGQTTGESWITTNDQVLAVVVDVIEALIPHERFVLVGHSAGGRLARALLHVLGDRVDGLLQVVPELPGSDDELPARRTLLRDDELVDRIRRELGPQIAEVFARNLVVQTPAVYERFKALLPAMTPPDPDFLDRLDPRFSFPVDRPATPFDRPTLFVLGRQDAVVGFRGAFDLIDSYPRATLAVLDRAGHAAPWEAEGVFRALVDDWLTRVEAETQGG
jgi:pimeloyl-ACP methyl ester carboxylesterase